ncbi:Chaperonin ClpA/B [Corchorus olitorius]|uniref:Chaperonin ClpA/B n=1 Tax=Corchorus olitorius TaxID=93759 RepID=A0A1R3G098_9ROSI|nr:Chaperonin ClpA/B [Corchorus olitorius]
MGGERKMDSDLELWMLKTIHSFETEEKWRLEGTYGVEIHPDSLPLCCHLITTYSKEFMEASDFEKERLLKEYMIKLLDAVCHRFACQLHKVAEDDTGLDIEYLLHRACIELAEIEKENDRCRHVWIPYVRREYADLMDKWHKFENRWKPMLVSHYTSQTGVEELTCMLRHVHKELMIYLQKENTINYNAADFVSNMFQQLESLRTKIELLIDKDLRPLLMVGPSEIEEATRQLVCIIPALWPCKFLKPHYQDLETRLIEGFIRHEHAIRDGEEVLAKAIAEQVFHDKERLTFMQYIYSVKRELIDAVKKKPYSVVFLQNIDKAHVSFIDFLLEILRDGSIADENGRKTDFSDTLIIMTLCLLGHNFRRWECDCAYNKAENLPQPEDHDDCRYLFLLKHGKQYIKPELYGIIDDVIVFEGLPNQDYRAIARNHLRNMTSSIGQGRLILYPSEAALWLIVKSCARDSGTIKSWLEENVAPKLLDIREGARMVRSVIYLDVLVGNDEFSYRVETGGCCVGNKKSDRFLANLWKIKDFYEKELLWLRKINGLRTTLEMIYGNGITKTNASIDHLQLLADMIENLLVISEVESEKNTMLWNLQVASANYNESAKFRRQMEVPKRTNKKEMEAVRTKLYTSLLDGHYVFDTVTRALISCIDCFLSSKVMENFSVVFLLLGLTTAGKEDLVKCLTKLVASENDTDTSLLLQVNFSECTEFDKFFNLIYGCFNHKACGILLIFQVEMTPMSVFSGLISALGNGMLLSDHGGCTVDLRHTIVILSSDLGNRDCIAQIFEPESEREQRSLIACTGTPNQSAFQDYMKQPERKRFRSELLYQVDEIVFFNPCASHGEQLTNFARLPMSAGPHIDSGPPITSTLSLQQLFHEGDHKVKETSNFP